MNRIVSWKIVVSHVGALALGLVLGYQIPTFNRSYKLVKEMEQVQSQIKQDPNNADNWSSLGAIKALASDTSGAIAAYRKALELDSSNVTANLGIGNLYYADGDYDAAEKWYSDALQAARKRNNPSEISTSQQLLKYAQAKKAGQRKNGKREGSVTQ